MVTATLSANTAPVKVTLDGASVPPTVSAPPAVMPPACNGPLASSVVEPPDAKLPAESVVASTSIRPLVAMIFPVVTAPVELMSTSRAEVILLVAAPPVVNTTEPPVEAMLAAISCPVVSIATLSAATSPPMVMLVGKAMPPTPTLSASPAVIEPVFISPAARTVAKVLLLRFPVVTSPPVETIATC